MTVPTLVRAGRATALLLARQSAKGTIATVFTGAGATTLRREDETVPLETMWSSDRDYMTSALVKETDATVKLDDKPVGDVLAFLTPASAAFLLRSNFMSSTYALVTQIPDSEWLTVAYVENTATGSTENLVRIRDCWMHQVKLAAGGAVGRVAIMAEFAGRSVAVQALNAGGVTLPAAPMAASDNNVFAVQSVSLVRDPAGANVTLPHVAVLEIAFDQRVEHSWDMMAQGWDLWKAGQLTASMRFRAQVSNETWAALTDARAGTKKRFKIVMTAPSPAKTLTVNLYEVGLRFENVRRTGLDAVEFDAVGEAGSDGVNSVSVTLT